MDDIIILLIALSYPYSKVIWSKVMFIDIWYRGRGGGYSYVQKMADYYCWWPILCRHGIFPFYLLANYVFNLFPLSVFTRVLLVLSFFTSVLQGISPQDAKFHDKSYQRFIKSFGKILFLIVSSNQKCLKTKIITLQLK